MLEIRPAKEQLEGALDSYINHYMIGHSEKEKQIFRSMIFNILNPEALEKMSIDAYAEIFTFAELEAMVEYYDKPEAQSARKKQPELNRKIAPEIVRMLDQAVIQLRTDASK